MPQYRKDQLGEFRTALDRNRRKVYATQRVCALCGRPVDFSLRYPDPMSKISNLQLAHLACNLAKSDKLAASGAQASAGANLVANRNLPQSRDWAAFKST